MDRRAFIQKTLGFTAFSSLPVSSLLSFSAEAEPSPEENPDTASELTQLQWQTMAQVQEHLFPSGDNTPGAKEINAHKFLHFVLSRPELDPDERVFITNGLSNLENLCEQTFHQGFASLNESQREDILQQFALTPEGEHWIHTLLLYVLEALLSDPVYGGNTGKIGWQWLDIQPGFPRPTINKQYFLL